MTKKQFDIETKRNFGDRLGKRDRIAYSETRLISGAFDLLDSRARSGGIGMHFKSRARALIRSGHRILPGYAPVDCAGGQVRKNDG